MDFWHTQAEQFRQWYAKQPGREWEDAFSQWADSKDWMPWDRLAIRALASRRPAAGGYEREAAA